MCGVGKVELHEMGIFDSSIGEDVHLLSQDLFVLLNGMRVSV
jgi:hypothetical protein